MEILYEILLGILLVAPLIYFSRRNNKVCEFRQSIISLLYNSLLNVPTNHFFIFNLILDRYSYARMLLSFKPLKIEKWYSEEIVKFLTISNKNGMDRLNPELQEEYKYRNN